MSLVAFHPHCPRCDARLTVDSAPLLRGGDLGDLEKLRAELGTVVCMAQGCRWQGTDWLERKVAG